MVIWCIYAKIPLDMALASSDANAQRNPKLQKGKKKVKLRFQVQNTKKKIQLLGLRSPRSSNIIVVVDEHASIPLPMQF